jgi:RNA polymerase sigma-70 factor, ECF subfamily
VSTEEANLIAGSQRGDVQAYEALVRTYEQVAFRAAFLITRDAEEAADAAQEAFLRAYRSLGSFKNDMPFRPWILRIVTNQALNRVKFAQRRARMAERYSIKVMTDSTTDESVEESEQKEQILRAVDELAEDERVLVLLRYFLELPEAEIAEALHIPLGTVKSRLHRALARLREIIRRELPELEAMFRNG